MRLHQQIECKIR